LKSQEIKTVKQKVTTNNDSDMMFIWHMAKLNFLDFNFKQQINWKVTPGNKILNYSWGLPPSYLLLVTFLYLSLPSLYFIRARWIRIPNQD
jgi:hypothetical protein